MAGLNPAQAARLAKAPVVVLSANRFTSQLVRSLLFGLGMRDVTVAATVAEAVTRVQLSQLDVVIADTGPATFDPLEALKALRGLGDGRQAGIPVLLLTSPSPSPEAALEALGNTHSLVKPLSQGPLKKAILRLLLNVEEPLAPVHGGKPGTPRLTTLLLSGNPYTAQVVRALLLTLGLSDLAVAGTQADAEQKLCHAAFDLVIADTGPASFDGLAMLEAVRDRAFRKAPVLLLASTPSAGLVERAKAAEVKAIATKPLDPDIFTDRVRKILALSAR